MDVFTLVSAVGLPLVMAIGGVLAWRATRKQHAAAAPAPGSSAWRDTSLDDWRRERDARAEEERRRRESAVAGPHPAEGQAREGETGRETRTRLGG